MPLLSQRRLPQGERFEAQEHAACKASCERFAAWVAPGHATLVLRERIGGAFQRSRTGTIEQMGMGGLIGRFRLWRKLVRINGLSPVVHVECEEQARTLQPGFFGIAPCSKR